MNEYTHAQQISAAIGRLRAEANLTQAKLAEKSDLDQSRIFRIEKGEVVAGADVDRVLDALDAHGVPKAKAFKEFIGREWQHIEPPSFWKGIIYLFTRLSARFLSGGAVARQLAPPRLPFFAISQGSVGFTARRPVILDFRSFSFFVFFAFRVSSDAV